MLDKQPIRISQFRGLYDKRPDIHFPLQNPPQNLESVLFGYAKTQQNFIFSNRGIQNRPPFKLNTTYGGTITNPFEIPNGGFIHTRGTDLYTDATLIQAGYSSLINVLIRQFGNNAGAEVYDCLISPFDAAKSVLLVNSGSAANRNAAGAPPASAPAAATGAAGRVELGTHLITVAFETDSGFITKYRIPTTVYISPGVVQVNLTAIPLGPAGTIARYILASKVIRQFNGDTAAYEVFFVPNGRIADNITTTLTIDFYDTELIRSADYLNDLESTLLGYLYLTTYNNRAVYKRLFGTTGNEFSTVLSLAGSPESVSLVDGVLNCPALKDTLVGFVYQGDLYLITLQQAYVFRDNGGPPNTWVPTIVSQGIFPTNLLTSIGIANLASKNEIDSRLIEDGILIATFSGLFHFRGRFDVDPITRNISGLWKRLFNADNSNSSVRTLCDARTSRIYVLGFADAEFSSTILIGDYKDGITADAIKWYTWKAPFNIQTGLVATIHGIFRVAGGVHLYNLTSSTIAPADNRDEDKTSGSIVKVPIDCIYESGLLPFSDNLDITQESNFRLNQRFDDYGAFPQQLVQFGAGIVGKYINYTYTLNDPRIKDFGFNFPNNRETFKWFFSTQEAATYKAVELLDAIIFHSIRAVAQKNS